MESLLFYRGRISRMTAFFKEVEKVVFASPVSLDKLVSTGS